MSTDEIHRENTHDETRIMNELTTVRNIFRGDVEPALDAFAEEPTAENLRAIRRAYVALDIALEDTAEAADEIDTDTPTWKAQDRARTLLGRTLDVAGGEAGHRFDTEYQIPTLLNEIDRATRDGRAVTDGGPGGAVATVDTEADDTTDTPTGDAHLTIQDGTDGYDLRPDQPGSKVAVQLDSYDGTVMVGFAGEATDLHLEFGATVDPEAAEQIGRELLRMADAARAGENRTHP